MNAFVFLPVLVVPFACLALLSLMALVGVLALAHTLRAIAAARSVMRFGARKGARAAALLKH